MTQLQSVFIACPVSDLENSRLVMCWAAGDPPPGGSFTMPMSESGEVPATHYALHMYADASVYTALKSGQIPATVHPLPIDLDFTGAYIVTEEMALNAAQQWSIRSSNEEDVMANLAAFEQESGLRRIV